MIYYIYHIPGTKIGVTKNVNKRMKEQGFTEWEILETHTCINQVSNREIQLQKDYGLPVDTVPYYVTLEAGRKGGIARGAAADNNFRNYTHEDWKELLKNNGGFLAKLTYEQVAEIRAKYTGKWGQQAELAREYGVTTRIMCNLLNNKTYKI